MRRVVARGVRLVPDGTVERWSTSAGRPGPTLTEPVVIAAFEGWNDAGDAATHRGPLPGRALGRRAGRRRSTPRSSTTSPSTRPQVRLDDDGLREIVWPTTDIFAGHDPGRRAGRAARSSAPSRSCGGAPTARELTEVAETLRRPPLHHARRAARRGAAHPAHADRRHRLRARRRRGPRAAAVPLRGPHRHRRRAARRLAAAPGSAPRRCGPPCPSYVPGRPVAEGRARAHRARRGDARRPGCPPPTSRSRPRPTSAR